MRLLAVNGIQLLERIDPNDVFLTELANAKCITWPQRDHIRSFLPPRDRNDKLLDFLTRRSMADFDRFINVLSKEQAHVVPLLVTAECKPYSIFLSQDESSLTICVMISR